MAYERRWGYIKQAISAVGLDGTISVPSTFGFHTNQRITVADSLDLNHIHLKIAEVISETQLKLQVIDRPIGNGYFPISITYVGGSITASEQPRVSIKIDEILRSVFEEEPAVAIRT